MLTTNNQANVATFTGIDHQPYGYSKGVRMSSWPSGSAEKTVLNIKSFYFPGKIKDLPSWYV